MLRERVQDITEKVENNVVDKYCYLEYTNVFDRNRTRALKVNGGDAHLPILPRAYIAEGVAQRNRQTVNETR